MTRRLEPPAYTAMLKEANRVGWPFRFRTDLTKHDRAWVERLPPAAPQGFVWVLREDATHIWAFGWRDGAGNSPADLIRSVAKDDPSARFYIWDGCALVPMRDGAHAAERTDELEELWSEAHAS